MKKKMLEGQAIFGFHAIELDVLDSTTISREECHFDFESGITLFQERFVFLFV